MSPYSLILPISTFGDYQARNSIMQNQLIWGCFNGLLLSIHGSAYGRHGLQISVDSFYGWLPINVVGQLTGWSVITYTNVHYATKKMRQFTNCWSRVCLHASSGLHCCSGVELQPKNSCFILWCGLLGIEKKCSYVTFKY
jgi:hypothetical protein